MKIFSKKGCFVFILLAVILLILELSFDFTELSIGRLVELTNSFRPRTGTAWRADIKDKQANIKLTELSEEMPTTEKVVQINDLYQLKTILNEQESALISTNQFLSIYTSIPPKFARQLAPPFSLLKLAHSKRWALTKLSKGDQQISVFFLDADRQLLQDYYAPLDAIFGISSQTSLNKSSLNSMPHFKDRLVSSEQFFNALLSLPDNIQRQLISNPFQLISWQQNLQSVAISRYITNYTVSIGFEISRGFETYTETFEASQLAVGYLINRLNELYPDVNISMPRP